MTRHSADNFITRLYPAAVQASQDTGLSWELMLAQAALETRWGRQGSLADTHNLFNIKADRQWKGPQQQVHVWEVEGGRTRWQHDGFRVYPDEAASLQDRNRFLQTQPRYARAGLLHPDTLGDYEREAQALQRAGYAADPHYASKLIRIVEGPTMQRALAHAQKQHGQLHPEAASPASDMPLQDADRWVQEAGKAVRVGQTVLFAAQQRFAPGTHEYGRSDGDWGRQGRANHSPNQRTDPSRSGQDLDQDGRKGIDCSMLVYQSLKDAGFQWPDAHLTTAMLFKGRHTTALARSHFDTLTPQEARQQLQPGDILMFKSRKGSGQHVGLFEGYDDQGHMRFFGSQVSTGPASVTVRPGGYWDGAGQEFLGALRPRHEYFTRTDKRTQADTPAQAAPDKPARQASPWMDTLCQQLRIGCPDIPAQQHGPIAEYLAGRLQSLQFPAQQLGRLVLEEHQGRQWLHAISQNGHALLSADLDKARQGLQPDRQHKHEPLQHSLAQRTSP